MMYLNKVDVVVSYSHEVRSPRVSMRMPSVVRMRRKAEVRRYRIRFSRTNVFLRDRHRCGYCGEPGRAQDLTFDHVIPRSTGGTTDWDNIVTACRGCNARKRDRTPVEAAMPLRIIPCRPKSLPFSGLDLDRPGIPAEWLDFCPQTGSPLSRC